MDRLAPIILFTYDMFCSDDDEEIDMETKEKHFVKEIEQMTTFQFKRHFRMDINTFESLLQKLHIHYNQSQIGHPEISLEESILICLWYLANAESFRGVAARFKVSKSTAWAAVRRICKSIIQINQVFGVIKWPSARMGQTEGQTISNAFFRAHHIPGIIGVIDGSHIRIVAPEEYPNSYINRKGYHSVILQGICDHQKMFTDVYIGEAGSVHDYTVFRKSDVSRRPREDFHHDSHLIGDLAYKLTTTMLVGFKNNGYLTEAQKNFNKILAKARVLIENTFALLKGRFRRLKFIESKIPENVCIIILTACILHNLCVLQHDNFEDINLNEEVLGERLRNPENIEINIQLDRQAQNKRNEIVNALVLL